MAVLSLVKYVMALVVVKIMLLLALLESPKGVDEADSGRDVREDGTSKFIGMRICNSHYGGCRETEAAQTAQIQDKGKGDWLETVVTFWLAHVKLRQGDWGEIMTTSTIILFFVMAAIILVLQLTFVLCPILLADLKDVKSDKKAFNVPRDSSCRYTMCKTLHPAQHANVWSKTGQSSPASSELINKKLQSLEGKLGAEGKGSSFLDAFCKPNMYHLFEFRRDHVFQQTHTVCPVSILAQLKPGQLGTGHNLQIEIGRLITYKDFPSTSPVYPTRLAQAGFFYTGEGDKVQCYSCGSTYQGWRMGDKPLVIHTSLKPDCPFIRSTSGLERDQPEPVTAVSLPYSSQVNPAQGKAGMLGGGRANGVQADGTKSMDSGYGTLGSAVSDGRAQSLNGHVSTLDGSSMSLQMDGTAHEPAVCGTDLLSLSGPPAMTGPAPNFVALQQGIGPSQSMGQETADGSVVSPSDGAAATTRHLLPSRRLDLGRAVYPLYSQMDARRRSYQNWQHVQGLPSVDELITLGFFYAGYADCVRCFFCGIGLKSWEADDSPADVHARWRPTCDYLRLVRGDDFVDRVAAAAASDGNESQNAHNLQRGGGNLPDAPERPSIRPAAQPTPREQAPVARNTAPQADQPRPAHANVSNQQNSAPTANRLPDIRAVNDARTTGYNDQQIQEAIDAIKNMGMESQMDTMLPEVLANLNVNRPPGRSVPNSAGNNNQQHSNNDLQQDNGFGDETPDAVGANPPPGERANGGNMEGGLHERQQVLQRENARLRDMRMCQRCHVNNVGVIFLPCGHIMACTDCAPNIRRCIRCNAVIRATANVYFS